VLITPSIRHGEPSGLKETFGPPGTGLMADERPLEGCQGSGPAKWEGRRHQDEEEEEEA
jgi:hypothetical protein